MINKQIQNYKITSLLGEGGMGTVYLAEHITIGRKVAVKIIHPHLLKNESIRERFKNEAAVMSKLQHPNIVLLYDYFSDENGLYLIMEYVDGIDLGSYLEKINAPLDEDLAKAFMNQMLSAFSHAHENNVIHRDIKPSNILITSNGTIKVLDFGIAKLLTTLESNQLTQTGTQLGTVYYMSPEQVQGKKVSHLSDIYALGVTFFQMLTAQNPYQKCVTEYEIYHKIVHEPLPNPKGFNPLISDSSVKILLKATKKDPQERFLSCVDWQNEMNAPQQQETIEPQEQTSPKTEATFVSSSDESSSSFPKFTNKTWVGIGLVALLAVVFYFWRSSENYKHVYVLPVTGMKFRSAPSIDSNKINHIKFGRSIAIIGDTIRNSYKNSNYSWVECKYKGEKGWVAFEINGQKTIGTLEDKNDFLSLFNGWPTGKNEYDHLNIEVHHAIIQYLKEKGLFIKFKYFSSKRTDDFRTVQIFDQNNFYSVLVLLRTNNKRDYKVIIQMDLKKDSRGNIHAKNIQGFFVENEVSYFRTKKIGGRVFFDAYDENKRFLKALISTIVEEIK
jgi:serine/threonine protein kinase